MTSPTNDTIDLDSLRHKRQRRTFISHLPTKAQEVAVAVQEAIDGEMDETLLDALAYRLGGLRHDAAELGLPSVAAVIARLMSLVKDLPQGEIPASCRRELEDCVGELGEATRTLGAELGEDPGSVLVIDSGEESLKHEVESLRNEGYDVLVTTDAYHGLKLARSEHPDVILLELNLPDTDGYELCYHLQHAPETERTPVLIVTTRDTPQDRAKAFAVGASAFLTKPAAWQSLVPTVRAQVNARRRGAHAHTSTEERPTPTLFHPCDFEAFRKAVREFLASASPAKSPGEDLRPSTALDQLYGAGISQEDVAQIISATCKLPYIPHIRAERLLLGLLPLSFCRSHRILTIEGTDGEAKAVLADPFQPGVVDALAPLLEEHHLGLAVSTPQVIEGLLHYEPRPLDTAPLVTSSELDVDEISGELHEIFVQIGNSTDVEAAEEEAAAPLIRLVNKLIDKADELGASDVHIEPAPNEVIIRYRVDGRLLIGYRLQPAKLIFALVARVKIMAGMDIAERRLPQDGRIVFKEYSHRAVDFDLRVSTVPVQFGEKVVMRLLDKRKSVLPLDKLGFSEHHLERYRQRIRAPFGMVLHVGPTGSGKSMTLYAALNEIKSTEVNIITAEDPIEYTLDGINQVQVKPGIGLNFARALRTFLRQDPDIILVGEIRDQETADVAVEAALTGHLLLSTLHTNDAATSVTRFIEMGIPPFLVSSTILMVCAQRLVRRLCPNCCTKAEPTARERALLGALAELVPALYHPGGCDSCRNTGYKGRIGIHEILIPDDEIRAAINQPGITAEKLKRMAVEKGMTTLYWDAMAKVVAGICSLEDTLNQVTPDEFDSCPTDWRENPSLCLAGLPTS